ncbi:hypothetical protein [Streptomyces sp. NPDC005078]|uniref:hypothetical protein n=1 Tax=unclassified Streptomyces TaxID=2593676 RepID=UPI0033B07D8F
MVHVLIITALKMEFDAALAAGSEVGIDRWEKRDTRTNAPYRLGEYVRPDGVSLSVALAQSVRTGGLRTSPLASQLAQRLNPCCLAMSGVLAGNPESTALGDVVVAEMAYAYDEGKQTSEGFLGDHRQFPLDDRVIHAARSIDTGSLQSFAVATDDEAKLWFLELLRCKQDPRNHPALRRYFPRGTWNTRLDAYARENLITRQDAGCTLTKQGRSYITRTIYNDVDGPARLPFNLVVGPVATGNVVVQDGATWKRLSNMGVRTITGLEMEAAAITAVANQEQIPFWIVAKGVMDHADPNKEDRYKEFAAKASAEVLYALLDELAETIAAEEGGRGPPNDTDWRSSLRKQGLRIWTPEMFATGMAKTDHEGLPALREGEVVDAVLLGAGRLPNLQRQFAGVARKFDTWMQRSGENGLRVFWLVGEAGTHRSKALLAAASRARQAGRAVYDPGRNLDIAADIIAELGLTNLPGAGVLIPIDLADNQSGAGWIKLLDTLDSIRRYENKHGNPDPVLVVGGTARQEQAAYGILQSSIEIESVDLMGRPRHRLGRDAGAESLASTSLPAEHIFNRGLPKTAPRLFGRKEKLAELTDAWLSDRIQILSVVAPGGAGKSALVNHWLRDMRDHDYLGAQRLLAWSFYSQGTKESLVSADTFVSSALEWLSDNEPLAMSPAARGARLAKLIRKHRFLLLLDGLEPLQHPEVAPDVGGMLTDPSLATLLDELAKPGWEGLCLITTQVPLNGLTPPGRGAPTTVDERGLDNLDKQAGAELLQSLIGPQRDVTEVEKAVQEVHGHALAVTLLGCYLRDVHCGQLSGRFELRGLTVAVDDGGHARRIMETYARWLERFGRSGELAILNVIGLFDRPAHYSAIAAVLANTELVRSAPEIGSAEWDNCLKKLRKMGLLGSETAGLPGTLDTHPLVREHFRDRIRTEANDLWEAGNRALYVYYQRRAPKLPPNVSDMNLLYAAVNHGCAIGLHQEVFDTVLLPRVWRGPDASYSTRILGMTGSEVVALSNYFHMPSWIELRDIPLSQRARLLVMANAGLRLRQLGRLDDARHTYGAAFRCLDLSSDDPKVMADAAFAASIYCELLVITGGLNAPVPGDSDSARSVAEAAIRFADQCEDPYFKMYSRSCLAEVNFMVGNSGRARVLFEEAKMIAEQEGARLPFLYSQNLYRNGCFVIEHGDAQELLTDAEQDPGWGLNGDNSSQLSHAIRQLILGAIYRSLVERGAVGRSHLATASAQMDDAIVRFRRIGYTDYTVRGLLERAHLLRTRRNPGDYLRALDDLDEALAETLRGSMNLLAADVYLQQAACQLAFWPSMAVEQQADAGARIADALTEADNRVHSLGYGRRYTMLNDVEQRAQAYGIS